jgi:hypothetical protein
MAVAFQGLKKNGTYTLLLITFMALLEVPLSTLLARKVIHSDITPPLLPTVPEHQSSYSDNQLCFPHNSPAWIDGPRWNNNHNDSNINDRYVHDMILSLPNLIEQAHPVLSQTLAINNSLFLNVHENDKDDEAQVRRWAIRLAYLALHYHQHAPAFPEAQTLYNHSLPMDCATVKQNWSIGTLDYECPGAQYLISSNTNNGLGANLDDILVSTLLSGLTSGRIVHFGQNMPNHTSSFFRGDWPLASCSHRRDYQCVFTAPSPCVPTLEDLANGYMLNDSEKRELQVTGKVPVNASHYKVVFIPRFKFVSSHKQGLFPVALERLQQLAHQLVDALPPSDTRIPILRQAADSLNVTDNARLAFNFASAESKSFHAITYYALRPWPAYNRRIDQMYKESLPFDFDPNTAIGLPIRGTCEIHILHKYSMCQNGNKYSFLVVKLMLVTHILIYYTISIFNVSGSDKCNRESECLSFDQHMHAALEEWENLSGQPFNATKPYVVFTTESRSLITEQKEYIAQQPPEHKVRFATNIHDVVPDSGRGVTYARGQVDADSAMLAALTTLKLQMVPRLTIGNCCSGFHTLIHFFRNGGLGTVNATASSSSVFRCLQELENPHYRLCCWKGKRCMEQKLKDIETWNQRHNTTMVI